MQAAHDEALCRPWSAMTAITQGGKQDREACATQPGQTFFAPLQTAESVGVLPDSTPRRRLGEREVSVCSLSCSCKLILLCTPLY